MEQIYQYGKEIYTDNKTEVKAAIGRIIKMCFIAKKDGILQLEAFILEEESFPEYTFLEKAISYICDGMELEDIKELLTNRILVEADRKKQFIYLLYQAGVELIKKEKPIYFVKVYLCSMFPQQQEAEINEYIEQIMKQENETIFQEKQIRVPREFAKISISLDDELKRKVEVLEKKIMEQTDQEIQEWLRQVESYDVISLLLVGSEEFRERLLNNMSSRLKIMMMEETIERAEAGRASKRVI